MTTWTKQPAIQGKFGGCLNCGPRPSFFPSDGLIAVGFGYAALHRDGEPVYTEPHEAENEDAYMTGERFGLKDLDPSAGRHDEPLPACSFFCELAEQEYTA